ncbi:hypothetical protein HJFPF1_12193 [Paramyrothecium foliicola]|nr:hypothetical protein HJFPF1_12193 [Paramyrothecium foliicola]
MQGAAAAFLLEAHRMASGAYYNIDQDPEGEDVADNRSWASRRPPTVESFKTSSTHKYQQVSAQRSRKRTPAQYLKTWAPEILWLVLTLGLFTTLVIVLAEFNDKPMPNWPLGLTLNTLVAVLATLCRTTITVPVAEAISQLKWNWFVAKQRSLKDLHLFDQASRGPWGSIILLPRLRGGFIFYNVVAVVILCSGVLTSFLTQSAITYSSRQVSTPRDDVITSAANQFPLVIDDSGEEDVYVTQAMFQAGLQAAFYPMNDTWPSPQPRCPSPSCSWPSFNSLGVCMSISNVTEHVKITTKNIGGSEYANISLADGFVNVPLVLKEGGAVSMVSPDLHLHKTGDDSTDFLFDDFPYKRRTLASWNNTDLIQAALYQLFVIYTVDGGDVENSTVRAAEVLWHLCVNTYNVSVAEGAPETKVIASEVTVSNIVSKPDSHNSNHFMMADAEGKTKFKVTQALAFASIDQAFRAAFSGTLSLGNVTLGMNQFTYQLTKNLYTPYSADESEESGEEELAWGRLKHYATTVADAMTAFMRKTNTAEDVRGQAITTETIVQIRWEWLSILAIQLGLALLFLTIVIFQTAKLEVDVVKSTNTAELFAMEKTTPSYRVTVTGPGAAPEQGGIATQIKPHEFATLVKEGGAWKLKVS